MSFKNGFVLDLNLLFINLAGCIRGYFTSLWASKSWSDYNIFRLLLHWNANCCNTNLSDITWNIR